MDNKSSMKLGLLIVSYYSKQWFLLHLKVFNSTQHLKIKLTVFMLGVMGTPILGVPVTRGSLNGVKYLAISHLSIKGWKIRYQMASLTM